MKLTDLFKIIVFVWEKLGDIIMAKRVDVGVGVGLVIGVGGSEKA